MPPQSLKSRLPLILLTVPLAVMTLAGCAAASQGATATSAATSSADCAGVWVEVDFGVLSDTNLASCVDTSAPMKGLDVLAAAGVTLEGTGDYGLDVVCRVNGLPSADDPLPVAGHEDYRESCATMTPEFAYWSLWVEDRATGSWDYAPVGIGDLSLGPGESLGLTFTTGTHTDPPTP